MSSCRSGGICDIVVRKLLTTVICLGLIKRIKVQIWSVLLNHFFQWSRRSFKCRSFAGLLRPTTLYQLKTEKGRKKNEKLDYNTLIEPFLTFYMRALSLGPGSLKIVTTHDWKITGFRHRISRWRIICLWAGRERCSHWLKVKYGVRDNEQKLQCINCRVQLIYINELSNL